MGEREGASGMQKYSTLDTFLVMTFTRVDRMPWIFPCFLLRLLCETPESDSPCLSRTVRSFRKARDKITQATDSCDDSGEENSSKRDDGDDHLCLSLEQLKDVRLGINEL